MWWARSACAAWKRAIKNAASSSREDKGSGHSNDRVAGNSRAASNSKDHSREASNKAVASRKRDSSPINKEGRGLISKRDNKTTISRISNGHQDPKGINEYFR